MLTSYDRYQREWRAKKLKAQLQRDREHREQETVPSTIVGLFVLRAIQRERQAVKDSLRGMESQ